MKIFLLLFFLFAFLLPKEAISQNNSHIFFADSLVNIIEVDYPKAKRVFIANETKYEYDPSLILYFLQVSLEKDDIDFFKEKIHYLIKEYGFRYTYSDTIKRGYELDDDFHKLIHEKGLSEWVIQCTASYYPEWIKTNPEAINLERFKELIYTNDQFIRKYSYQIRSECLPLIKSDSIAHEAFSKKMGTLFNEYNLQNVYFVSELIESNDGKLPTNFNCIGITTYIELIVFHNMKGLANLQLTWNLLHESFEQAYIEGKIPKNFFSYYDRYLNEQKGFQYYGTLGNDVPVENKKEFLKRKEYLKL